MGIEARQGKQGGRRGRGAKRVDLPGELWPDPERFIEEAVSFCRESTGAHAGDRAGPRPWLTGHWVPRQAGSAALIPPGLKARPPEPEARLSDAGRGDGLVWETEPLGSTGQSALPVPQRCNPSSSSHALGKACRASTGRSGFEGRWAES